MELAGPLGLTIVCAGVGLAAYCLACAVDVWRRRNRKASPQHTGEIRARGRFRRAAFAVCGLGVAGMVGGFLLHAFLHWEGVLEGEQLFVVMKPREELVLQDLTPADEVQQGVVVARFTPVEREAERSPTDAPRERPLSERSLSIQRFLADSQIGRELQDAAARQLELEMAIKDVVLEASRLNRTTVEERLHREDEIHKLQIDRQQAASELEQATARLRFKRGQAERHRVLHNQQLISTEQLQEALQEVQVRESEVVKLEEKIRRLDALRSSVEQGVDTMQLANRRHAQALEEQLAKLNAQLSEAQRGRRSLVAFVETMNVVAPFSGRIVYRDPSPKTVPPNAPIIIIAPPGGLRVKVRMPEREMPGLAAAGMVHFRLPAAYHVSREERQFIERRFPARLRGWKALPHDPRFVVAEFAADLPAEAIREMVSRRQVTAELVWIPPLLSIPAFAVGAAMVAVACLGTIVLALVPGRGSPRLPVSDSSLVAVAHTNGADDDGPALRALGADIRDMIRLRHIDTKTLAAAESAVDRYRLRASRLLSVGLAFDATLAMPLQEWAHALLDEDDPETLELFQRLLRLLTLVVAERYQPLARRLERAAARTQYDGARRSS